MALLPTSATSAIVPSAFSATLVGRMKRASVLYIVLLPDVLALPANVVTSPVVSSIRRMVLLLVSATNANVPPASMAIPSGWLKRAVAV